MHMWMWFGYDLGEFLFSGLTINTRWSFALTWIVLFFVAVLFEGSKVYLAKVQREALKKLYPYRSDERRTLLCDRERGGPMEATTSRNASTGQVSRWASVKIRALVNAHQSLVFVAHNTVGYLLMLAVMVYNVQLLLAVVLGMMLGYFLFGTKLTRLQMRCFGTKRVVVCTPECDDTDRCNTEKCSWEQCEGRLCKQLDALELQQSATPLEPYALSDQEKRLEILTTNIVILSLAEHTTVNSAQSSEADLFICRTRTCIQPSHYFPATSPDGAGPSNATCYYGAQRCPSMIAKAERVKAASQCHHTEGDKDDGPSVEDAQLLGTERQGCCKKQELPKETCCRSSQVDTSAVVQTNREWSESDSIATRQEQLTREDSPQITCCHNAKSTPTDSQEQIIKEL